MSLEDSTTATLTTVLADRPDVLDQLEAAHEAAMAAIDPQLLELCQRRISMLLGRDGDADPDLAQWPSSPAYDDTQRACLAYTEQHVIDVARMDDATVAAVADALGADGLVNFANALLVVEQRIRLRLIWESLLPAGPR